jgi:hypothetical protein
VSGRALPVVGWRLAAGVIAALCLCIAPAVAGGYTAGEYSVEACTAAVGYANDSWTFATNDAAYIEEHTSCGEPPLSGDPPVLANLALGDTLGPHGVLVGTTGSLSVTAPEGETISEISGSDTLMKVGGNKAWNVYLATQNTEGQTTVQQTCTTSATENVCAAGGPFTISGLHAKTATIGAECDAEEYEPGHSYTTCARGNEFGHAVRAGFNYATVTLNDPTPPTDVAAAAIPSGSQHGSITIDGSATDTTAGLLAVAIIDSTGITVAGPVSFAATCDYSHLTPCPTRESEIAIPLDTEGLPDGADQIRIVATNAAHDETTSEPYTLNVSNHPTSTTEETSHTETTNKPQTTASIQPTPNPLATGTKAVSEPITPTIRLVKPQRRHNSLIISGVMSASATGAVQCSIRGRLRDRQRWSAAATGPLLDGHFKCKIRLARSLRIGRVTIEIDYPGGGRYHATRLREHSKL